MAASDLLQRRAAAQRHGGLIVSSSSLNICSTFLTVGLAAGHGEGEQHGPSNQTEDKHDALAYMPSNLKLACGGGIRYLELHLGKSYVLSSQSLQGNYWP